MTIQEGVKLAPYTTFRIGGPARFFCRVKSEEDIIQAVSFARKNGISFLVIGGGSNILIPDEGYLGLVIHNEIMGREYVEESKTDFVLAKIGAGEDWTEFVAETVNKNLYGLEALSAIPGTVGATPIQNVGAYGCDVSKTIVSLRAFDTKLNDFVELKNEDCRFTYRNSRFREEKGRFIISSVVFRLRKSGSPKVEYADLKKYFEGRSDDNPPSLREVHEAVIKIRMNKLPDWHVWGTAGSFFKNPIISAEKFEELKSKYPDLPGFPEKDGRVKVQLGWILDKICNAKGFFVGNVGTYEKQALVLVAKPGATASEIVNFSNELMKLVYEKTGIKIEGEVEWAVA